MRRRRRRLRLRWTTVVFRVVIMMTVLPFHGRSFVGTRDHTVRKVHRFRPTPRVDVNDVHESEVVGEDGVVVQQLDLESGVECILLHDQLFEEGGRHSGLAAQVLATRNVVLSPLIRL